MGADATQEILGADEIATLLDGWAEELAREHGGAAGLALVGIKRRGDALARRLAERLETRLGREIPCGSLDITLYRDDFDSLSEHPIVGDTDLPFSVDGRTIVLVDDVLFTGRTICAALDELLDLGRPARVALAVLVDRGWRELPIAPDLVGRRIETAREDNVQVLLREEDGRDAVLLSRRA